MTQTKSIFLRRSVTLAVLLALAAALLPAAPAAQAVSTDIVISEFRTRGPNGGSDEFIELYNLSGATVDISGWKINGSNNAGTTSTRATIPGGTTLGAGCRYLLTNSSTSGGPYSGPTPGDMTYATGISDDGGLALLRADNSIVDAAGMSSGSAYKEGTTLAPTTSNLNQSYERQPNGLDTDQNASDFVLNAASSNPQNRASTCTPPPVETAPSVSATTPANGAMNVALYQNLAITFSEPVNLGANWVQVSCAASGVHAVAVSGGPAAFTLDPLSDFFAAETCTVTVFANQVSDQDLNDPPDAMAADYVFSFTTLTPVKIREIQGAGHVSPLAGQMVGNVVGVVTALRTTGSTRGFYLQEPDASIDADPTTSEGIFVFTGSSSNPAATVAVGNLVGVSGQVQEYRPAAASLSITEIIPDPSQITVVLHSQPLPAPVVLGAGGRVPPNAIIENDAAGDVETPGTLFDPAQDGLDFYESLEGMRVQVNHAVAAGPRIDFTTNREIQVLADGGTGAGLRSARGGIVIAASDYNPERIILNDWISGGPTLPAAVTGDSFPGAILGVIDYSFNNFKLQVSSLPALAAGGLAAEVTAAARSNELAVATLNTENLDAADPDAKFNQLAEIVVNHLRSPDLLALEEIQDNNGAVNDGTVAADQTLAKLITAIQAAGGPLYQARQIDPQDDQDGGEPGGNIRVAFLLREDRGLSFVGRGSCGSTDPTAVTSTPQGPQLSCSPGRIDPANTAFTDSRKPLAGEFLYRGRRLFVVANHFNSKGGDQPLFGRFQPPVLSSAVQRTAQAQIVHNFVNQILALDPHALVVVLGDLNDFEFSAPIQALCGSILTPLVSILPLNERYSYIYDGNSQTLDHILITNDMLNRLPFDFDIVHVNAEFTARASDHDPSILRLALPTYYLPVINR